MRPIGSGKVFLVEECRRLDFSDIRKKARTKLIKALIIAEIEAAGYDLCLATSKTGFGGTREWFKCPLCGHKRRVLHVHPVTHAVGCRRCLGLEYRSRRFKGMVENRIGL
jgi:hypothetical protein